MSLYPTKNDIPAGDREKLVELLNGALSTASHLTLQAKQAHWNVKGPHFIALHELFDKVYSDAGGWVDLIAERAVALGGVAKGSLASVNAGTKLPAYDETLSSGRAHVDALSTSVAVFGKLVRAASGAAGELGDDDTADLFTEVSREADKTLWFLEAHLHSD